MKKKIGSVFLSPGLAIVLAALIVLCRFNTRAADFYAEKVYPAVSAALSFISSAVPVSVNDVAIAAMIVAAIVILILSISGRKSWKHFIFKELELALWAFVWFYAGWCTNYSRSDIFARADTGRSAYDEQVFDSFLRDYTEALNESYVTVAEKDEEKTEAQVKAFYEKVPERYGLCTPKRWQHSKPMLIHRIQSAVGVTGYMGPLGGEFHINEDVLPENYPFTFAHEYAHLMGVSSEAEANWWAFQACRASDDPAVRYSGYFSVLSYIWNNAYALLGEESFKQWRGTVRPEIVEELIAEGEYWDSRRIPALDKAQTFIYDLFLKANRVGSGIKNYSEVVQMMISLDDLVVETLEQFDPALELVLE